MAPPHSVGFAYVSVELATDSYLIDPMACTSSATAAITVLRNVLAAALPLAGPPLFAKLELGKRCTVLGLAALVFVPVPVLLVKHGERVGGKERFQVRV